MVTTKIDWNEFPKAGVPEIDLQHKELVAVFNDLADAIEKGQGARVIKKLLSYLRYYAEWHFEREEKCANRYHCPIAATNKQAHQKFMETFGALLDEYRKSDASEELAIRVYNELSDWLISHVKKIDTQIGECVHQQRTTT